MTLIKDIPDLGGIDKLEVTTDLVYDEWERVMDLTELSEPMRDFYSSTATVVTLKYQHEGKRGRLFRRRGMCR
ncbi:MAG: hypothetical protein ACFFB5_19050 [Promethearchaeota archaeon]